MLFGTLADNVGRRIIYASCLLILSLTCVGLALTPTSAYWLLLVLRCLQSTGSASTIALGAGVIGDISEAHERGGFFGLYQSGPLLAPAIGPVIGGALAGSLGWRFLPETLRSIVGNGSLRTSAIHRPLIWVVGRGRVGTVAVQSSHENGKVQKLRMKNPFAILKNLDITLILFFNGTVSAVYYAVTATISTLFAEAYPFLSETEVGLCFLSIGGGMFAGSLSSGIILDWEFRRVQTEVDKKRKAEGASSEKKMGRYDADYPIEKARLRLLPLFMVFFIGSTIGYGWCIERQVNISGPLIFQFIVGYTAIIVLNASATFVIDLMPNQSSSVSACVGVLLSGSAAGLISRLM
ncbi:hypothetical protein D9757_000816 [Collybiopsis confluens]|uniref:Major facilitator superfamily (MFS) profile domain-containing protein n=1 Tax=Collybiopsis confluens TaxID=2823264 RepID=A0A8H5I0X2_9AGAR|nr:hypothetical protein D9757_000816 [Collybiopsis confluens]